MAVRASLIAAIRGIVGDSAHVIDVEDNKDVPDLITIMVKQRAMARLPEAPNGALRIDYVLSITHPATDPAVSEPALDDYVPGFLTDLNAHRAWLGWTTATKTLDGQNLGYDIDAYVIAGPQGE